MFSISSLLTEFNTHPFSLIINLVIIICVFSVFIAVLIDFTEFEARKDAKKEKKSVVETGTMFLFFFLFYFLIRFSVGSLFIKIGFLEIFLVIIGAIILVLGCIVNIIGRFNLGKNWSNQIKIYKDHTFISGGVYKIVRHPLYASIIWMFFGASLIFLNYVAFLANILIFIPFMYYRAKQ